MFANVNAALAQRSSTMEERLLLSHNERRVSEWPDGHLIGLRKAATPQRCRDLCLANKQCRYWSWTAPGRYRGTPETDESCELLAGIVEAGPGEDDQGNYAGRVTGETLTAGGQTPSPATPAGELFPHPRPGQEIVFQVPSANNPNAERYAMFRFLSSAADRKQVLARVWEGPLSNPPTGGDQIFSQVFDEGLGEMRFSTCSVNVPERDLRRIAVGAKLTYIRTCNSTFSTGRGHSEATIARTVERSERVTVPAGTFDALVVKKITRTQYTSYDRDGDLSETETSENELTRWWVPALGFYVKEQARSRVVNRTFSQKLIDAYRRDGEPLRPRSTDWFSGPAMVAIIVR